MSFTRRRFLKTATAAALVSQLPMPRARGQNPAKNLIDPSKKLRVAGIGVGGQGGGNLKHFTDENVVALCDVDFFRASESFQLFPNAARYRDYRNMLTEMHDEIDAVVISTPDHTHFPATVMALEHGKHAYVEKPLTHTIGEARALRELAKKANVVTQMGNHGHANEGTRLVKEWIDAGVIGPVHTVHCWTNRPVWPQGLNLPQESPKVPDSLDWNLWQGVAPNRPYSPEYLPFSWRGWWDYGCGALGDMGCHVMDAPFWSLDLRGDFRISAESEGGNAVCAPKWSVVRYEFPQRGERPPVNLTWFEGGVLPPRPGALGDAEMPIGGTLYYGEKGILFAPGDYSESPRLLPEEKMKEFRERPPKTIARIPRGNARQEFIDACKGGPMPGSNFVDHACELTEMVLAGNLAIRMARTLNWDSKAGVCIGDSDADRLINKTYRLF